MKFSWLCVSAFALGLSSCGGNTDTSPGGTEPGLASAPAPQSQDNGAGANPTQVKPSETPPPENAPSIPATGTLDGDTSAEGKVKIALRMADDNRVGGTLEIGDVTHSLAGILDDTTIRCWTTAGVGNQGTTWRGTLLGNGSGATFQGTFNLSDSGAAKILSGTWKTD